MHHQWTHVGRLWTNGDPFLAVDATLRDAWLGFSQDQYSQVVGLGPQDASITVGTGRAAVVGADAVVRDDSWMEVFEAAGGQVAIVQAAGPDYPDALGRALEYPDADDEDGGTLNVPSGELVIFSAAADGTGPYSMPLLTARPGTVPPVHGPPPAGKVDPGLLAVPVCPDCVRAQSPLVHQTRPAQLLRAVASDPGRDRRLNNDPSRTPRPHHAEGGVSQQGAAS